MNKSSSDQPHRINVTKVFLRIAKKFNFSRNTENTLILI